MADNAGKTVAEILKNKKGYIRQVRLKKGSPSWDDILHLTWEEIVDRANKRERGFRTFKKLLEKSEYDK